MKNTFETKDLYLASLFYAKGIKLSDIRRDGRECFFIFNDQEKCNEIEKHYWSKEETVNAKEYTDAVKTLKGLLFIR
ncbi:hypothetical protein A3F57_03235 [Candidatus Roizmanbacteria bacterium RIFCSPHIGHO2_12_FULL_36_11]|uniref:DUF5659 domain-containing protein n=1 Tax=Candidatus Curtissbacteria bacterium RIFCSPLOWO2_01_FULL_37_9 TaxID=1797724 RepID=A0A1F5GUL0_9BACT|nr:MAG: hypothetical protein A3A48_03730 [Candidatus Curtissbacteria bacterium RIFCSPLOWO2_01_FULL_37_9]OGK32576.1 MAG: hypothetical protein A3F57_03235 [Candidatus Roizmanbacteria bacterium RIFCSPHIGHO2_12_FULL_36_11]